jgi:hypothetical protein
MGSASAGAPSLRAPRGNEGAGPEEGPAGAALPGADRPVFWKEVYWFALICLGGWMLALAVLPERLARHRATLDLEEDLQAAVAGLGDLERQYEAAIAAVESDPFYKEEVQRHRLGVKRRGETLLAPPGELPAPGPGEAEGPTPATPPHDPAGKTAPKVPAANFR